MVVVDRHTSLSDLSSRLSKTILHSRPFTLKYQIPNEDLDSLISVTTDEDLDNMIDEYDRLCSNSTSLKSSRLRLFLFPTKPDSASSIGSILDNSVKSEDWFLDALNGATGALNRGFSDSQTMNCLLGLETDAGNGGGGGGGGVIDGMLVSRELDGSQTDFGNCKNAKQGGQDVHSVPDSPMLDTTSSFGSTSSSPSLAHLPPIRVHVDDGGVRVQDQRMGIEEQFAQISVAAAAQKQDEGFVGLSSPPPPMPTSIVPSIAVSAVPMTSAATSNDYSNRVFSDDERSEQGMPVGYRRPPQPQPQIQLQTMPLQSQQKPTGGVDLTSPDSVSSDNSLTNAIYRQKAMNYQESASQIPSGRVSANPVDPKTITDPNTRVQIQQVQESGYMYQPQFEQQHQQQQFVHAGAHYMQHHPGGQVPMSSYYPVYPSQQQQQQQHSLHQQQLDQQQYPVYYMAARPPQPQQAYNVSMQQPSYSEAPAANPSNRPQTPPPNPTMIHTQATYNPARNAPPQKTEIAAGVYRTAAAAGAAPSMVQVASNQMQQQYVGYSQIHHHPSQSIAPNSMATANYGYEYADPAHAQIYYSQPFVPTSPAQYQTMTSNPAVMLSEASTQLPGDNMKQQQIRPSQA